MGWGGHSLTSQLKTLAFNLSSLGGSKKREIVGEECHDLNFIVE